MLNKVVGVSLQWIAVILVSFMIGEAAFAEMGVDYKLSIENGSKVGMEGNSTLHPYESWSKVISLDTTLNYKGDIAKLSGTNFYNMILSGPSVSKLILKVAVTNMKSPEGGMLDNNMYETMKAKENPDIVFTLSKYDVKSDPAAFNKFLLTLDGTLKIAGKERPVTLDAVAVTDANQIHLTGKFPMKQTDFGIKPYSLLIISCDDKIVVKWDLFIHAMPK